MTAKKPFHEYILAQLRELELTSSTLSQVREKYRAACRHRCAALSDDYVDRIVMPGTLGYSTFQR